MRFAKVSGMHGQGFAGWARLGEACFIGQALPLWVDGRLLAAAAGTD